MKKQIYDEKNGLNYTLHGDYYLPDLEINEEEPTYGKYGIMRKQFLKEHRSARYQYLVLTGKLTEHLNQVDKEARENVHILRNELTAIMIGIDTVIIDNPELTCRIPNGRNPIRIVVDSNLRIPYDSKILQTAKKFKTIIATTEKARKEKIHKLKDLGIIVIETKSKNEKVDLKDLMHKLGNQNIDSILLEGGSTLNYSALESGIVDKILVYIAPKIIGGMKSKTPVGGSGISHLKDAFKVRELSTSIIGKDILLQGYIEGDES